MLTTLFKAVDKVIKKRLPEVKYFGLYREQFENLDSERPIGYPAILLEVPEIQFEQLLQGVQRTDVTIILHLGIEISNSIERGDRKINESLLQLELADRVWDAFNIRGSNYELTGLTETRMSFGAFRRISTEVNIPTISTSIFHSKVTFTLPINVKLLTPGIYVDISEFNIETFGI